MSETGLRERKKQRTRQAIGEAAFRLFEERGFENVTVAEVARAADVSEGTVFNYFPTKEDLVLGDAESLDEDFLRAISARAPGESVLDAVRTHTLATASRMREAPAATRLAFRTVLQGAPSVRARWRDGSRVQEEKLAALLASETSAETGDASPFVVAGVLGLLRRLAFYDVIGWPDGKRRSAAKSEEAIRRAFDLLGAGIAEYGVRGRKRESRGV
jgi:AcrR family transcriptional regulator